MFPTRCRFGGDGQQAQAGHLRCAHAQLVAVCPECWLITESETARRDLRQGFPGRVAQLVAAGSCCAARSLDLVAYSVADYGGIVVSSAGEAIMHAANRHLLRPNDPLRTVTSRSPKKFGGTVIDGVRPGS